MGDSTENKFPQWTPRRKKESSIISREPFGANCHDSKNLIKAFATSFACVIDRSCPAESNITSVDDGIRVYAIFVRQLSCLLYPEERQRVNTSMQVKLKLTWMSKTFRPLVLSNLNWEPKPRMGPSRIEEARAALYPVRWADWIRRS